ncbi:MAG: pyruvate phosphate dikinase PEP/pyruvate-binding protein [Nitrospirae bacterium]|nr:pyruvate phosphate dikinase PEP/pyruvate-binding protein [Nitrospirota bacterium]
MKDFSKLLKSVLRLPFKHAPEPLSFKDTFNRFREVLDSNNRALELITDMGEKLGGDYLFDINYIKGSYSDLYSAISQSVQSFDALTGGRYAELRDVFSRIDNRIKSMIFDITSATGEITAFYEDITWDMSGEIGGKNANLSELKNYLKLNVPEAFAVTTHAFDELVKHNGLREKIEALSGKEVNGQALKEMHDMILNTEIPASVYNAIESAIGKIKTRCGQDCFIAVRSSATEEDGEFSFAGQFETILNVPLESVKVIEAYKKVVASLFSAKTAAYLRQLGYDIRNIINANWGLGITVVEGEADADLYLVKKGVIPVIIEEKTGAKELMTVNIKEGGTSKVKTPEAMRANHCLTREQALELAIQATRIERHFRKPQDIEWALDKNGKIFILQSRTLKISGNGQEVSETHRGVPRYATANKILMENKGTVVQRGVGAGKIFIPAYPDDLNHFPKGSVLVSKHDSSDFVRIMPFASAIITDVGTPTSHMASLCREFRVPTIVGTGDATLFLKQGQEITVYADDEANALIYSGIVRELLEYAGVDFGKMEDVYEYRRRRYILRYISPLNLIDPLLDNFTVGGCKTMHDILRFMHEKSVAELVDRARYGNAMLKKNAAVKLDLSIPSGIIAIDIGGGLDIPEGSEKAAFDQVTSIPLKAILKGMMHPGVWHSEAVALRVNDFLSSMMRMPDITADSSDYVGYNVAVASREYVNLSLKFGYHYNMIDSYCSDNTRNNHIYFRFVGGATDIVKRSRRIHLLSVILKEYGFNLTTKGDLIIARLSNISRDEIVELLDQSGRLIAFTRQLDALLHDDAAVERYANNFLKGRYELSNG